MQEEAGEQPADCMVTVFGIGSRQAAAVMQRFSNHGSIVRYLCNPSQNWMHLQFEVRCSTVIVRYSHTKSASLADCRSPLRHHIYPN